MAGPSLVIPVGADISKFQRAMNDTTSIATKATLAITKQAIQMSTGFLASQGAAGAATIAFGRLLGAAGPVLLAITAIKDAFKLMNYATELAKARIEEFNKVTAEANATGFSTDFFQRVTKSAGDARDKIADITEALKKFNAASTDKLGGSDLQKRLDELQKAGNFGGAAIGGNNSEEKLRSVVALIDDAMQKGQRLAALDLAENAFGPKVAAALRADSGYLDDMLKRADAIKKTQLISEEDLGRAQDLQRRIDAAQKILADKWKPVQDDLASLGTNYHDSWVSITETMARAVGFATDLYSTMKQLPDALASAGNASFWQKLTDATGKLGLNSAPDDLVTDPAEIKKYTAQQRLNAALQNYSNVTRSMRETSDVVSAVRGDTSKAPGKDIGESANSYDRANEAIEKHIARLGADAQAQGLSTAAQTQLRTEATLTTAAMQAYGKVSADTAKDIAELAKRSGDAAAALEKAKVAAAIDFGRKTAFLSEEDVNIARTLAGVYGNDVSAALASSEAAALRMNSAMSDISRTLQDTNRGAFVDFTQQIRNGATAMDALRTAGVNALGKIADKLVSMAADNLWSSAFGGSGGLGGFFGSLFKGVGGSGLSAPQSILPPIYGNGTNYHPGGLAIVGDKGPELVNLPRGSQVIPNNLLPSIPAAAANDNSSISAPVSISIDARGADREGLAVVSNQLAKLQSELPSRVVAAVQDAKKRRVLA